MITMAQQNKQIHFQNPGKDCCKAHGTWWKPAFQNAFCRISTMKLIKSGFIDLLGGKYILSAKNPWVLLLNMKDIGFL